MSSSPVSVSPNRRRSTSPSELSDATTRPRQSPTLSRSYDPNDPHVRERQRTMDVDMAIHLSRARRETIDSSPRDLGTESPVDDDVLLNATSQPSITTLPHLHQSHDPSLLVSLDPPSHDDPATAFGILPTYQPNVSRSHFDFARMEDFAREEKARLGISSPVNARLDFSALRRRQQPPNQPPADTSTDDQPPSDQQTPAPPPSRPLRHRKLSQSNPNPRHRKGIGGKMALFETNNSDGPSSLPARLGLALTGQNPIDNQHLPVSLTPGGGILNTGHDRPYRFSFYSNALSATIHARSLSELPAEGQSFEDLFAGALPQSPPSQLHLKDILAPSTPDPSRLPSPVGHGGSYFNLSLPSQRRPATTPSTDTKIPPSTTNHSLNPNPVEMDGNTWWLDVQSPTDEEMKMLSKVFSIHPLTTEDILMEETREKIELFRNYYLVCFRSFDQDQYSPTHLEPLNMYIIVFREGILSFHFRPTPHPQNVRRRIKQLKDYISVTSDWISYALIDDITDAFGPLIQSIEYEVDSIDELVLILKEAEQSDMLRRIGTCRKKVMGLLRLMGNKADVVKGLAKRCNENWRVAPTSDIGLYLSDIQDHLITMTQNLNHYEKILSRSHSNYLAQISIEMTDANNQINDVLSKLTALGTVLIPMNLVTGLWGMNVHVPGQGQDGYAWFVSIIAGLAAFAMIGGYSTYRFMVRRK